MREDAGKLSQFARVFLIASNRCLERRPLPNGQFEMPLIPAAVCMAFSVELNFKVIIKAQGDKAKGHRLDKLYAKIAEPERSSIIEEIGLSDKEFRKKLSEIGNAFVDWRYVYEHESISLDLDFLRRLSEAAQKTSTALRGRHRISVASS